VAQTTGITVEPLYLIDDSKNFFNGLVRAKI